MGSFFHRTVEPLKEAVAHAVFMDVTHDNPSQFEVKILLVDAIENSLVEIGLHNFVIPQDL